MKNLLLKAAVLMLVTGSCSAPKYSYFFSHTPSTVNKQKGELTQNKPNETLILESPSIETPTLLTSEEPIALASAGRNIPAGLSLPVLQSEKKGGDLHFTGKVRKALKGQIKEALNTYKKETRNLAPDSAQAEGKKNQLVALLLAIFLGGLGVHRFYLGRIWTGVVQLLLLVTAFLIAPLYILGIWVLIDIILIAMGKLTPKNGPYDTTL